MPLNDDDLFGPAEPGGAALTDEGLFGALRGAEEIKAQPPLWKRALGEAKGFAQELPLIGMRGVNLLQDVAQGKKPWDPAREMERASRMRKIEEALGAAETSGLPEQRPGRILARMVPQAAVAAATGGMSLPAQAAIQGGVQGLQSLSEGASPETALTGAGIAALAPGAGRAVNAGASWLKAPFAGVVDQPAMEAAGRLGVELPASAATNSSVARGLEQMGSRMLGGGAIERRGIQAAEDVAGRAQRMTAGADPTLAGRGIATDVGAARAALQAAKNAEYGKVGSLTDIPGVPEGTLAEVDRMLAQGTAAPDVLARLRALREAVAPKAAELPPELQKLLEQYADDPKMQEVILKQAGVESAAPAPRSVADLMSQQAGLEYGGPNALSDAALANRLRESLGGDINRILAEASPDQLQQLGIAKEAYGRYADFSKSRLGKVASEFGEAGQFDKIPDALLRSSESVADLGRLMRASTPETQNQIREVLLRKIIGNAESITPKQIERGLSTYGKAAKAILTPEQLATLRDLSAVKKAMGKTTIGSPTTPLLQARKYLETPVRAGAALAGGGFPYLAAELGGEALIARLLGSKGGQKWLTTGLGPAVVPGSLVRAGSVATSRIPSEVEMEKRRRALEAALAGR